MPRKVRAYRRLERYRQILSMLFTEFELKCFFCKKQFTNEDISPRVVDQLTIHHKDFNHENNSKGNLVLAHRTCHKSFHLSKLHEEEKI